MEGFNMKAVKKDGNIYVTFGADGLTESDVKEILLTMQQARADESNSCKLNEGADKLYELIGMLDDLEFEADMTECSKELAKNASSKLYEVASLFEVLSAILNVDERGEAR